MSESKESATLIIAVNQSPLLFFFQSLNLRVLCATSNFCLRSLIVVFGSLVLLYEL